MPATRIPRCASGSAMRPVPMPSSRGAVARQLGEEVDCRIDDRRLEHVGGRLVVPLRHPLAEVVLGHERTLPAAVPQGVSPGL
jgi:hypothetical protein